MDSFQVEDGVIVGTSRRQEWLLPWWWMHYCLHNNFPVTFVDFGDLSDEAIKWCRERGRVIKLELSDEFMTGKEGIDPKQAAMWEKMQPNLWTLRFTWFKKPFAILLSPYKRTLWLDLDCQIRGSIHPLFELCENEGGFAIAAEHPPSQHLNLMRGIIKPGEVMYNAGVLVVKKHSAILNEWIARAKDQNHLYCSDQQLLASILNSKKFIFTTLSPVYNWTADMAFKPEVIILHWWGDQGKKSITFIMENLTRNFHFNLTFNS